MAENKPPARAYQPVAKGHAPTCPYHSHAAARGNAWADCDCLEDWPVGALPQADADALRAQLATTERERDAALADRDRARTAEDYLKRCVDGWKQMEADACRQALSAEDRRREVEAERDTLRRAAADHAREMVSAVRGALAELDAEREKGRVVAGALRAALRDVLKGLPLCVTCEGPATWCARDPRHEGCDAHMASWTGVHDELPHAAAVRTALRLLAEPTDEKEPK